VFIRRKCIKPYTNCYPKLSSQVRRTKYKKEKKKKKNDRKKKERKKRCRGIKGFLTQNESKDPKEGIAYSNFLPMMGMYFRL